MTLELVELAYLFAEPIVLVFGCFLFVFFLVGAISLLVN
jgi:hypothetical protein